VLEIGGQGAGGLGIPIGKLALYSAIGGIHPARTLPVVLDDGTNNRALLDDPEYIGWRHDRIEGEAYVDFVDRFVAAVEQELPGTLLQWDDFATAHARPILDRYRDRLLTFNDDILGIAAVVVGALAGAVHASGHGWAISWSRCWAPGRPGIGVAGMLRAQMVADGASDDGAARRFFVVDKTGLLTADRREAGAGRAVQQRLDLPHRRPGCRRGGHPPCDRRRRGVRQRRRAARPGRGVAMEPDVRLTACRRRPRARLASLARGSTRCPGSERNGCAPGARCAPRSSERGPARTSLRA
jgi:hypothetical protein